MNDLMTKSFLNYVDLKKQAIRDRQLEDLSSETTSSTQENDDEEQNNLSLFFQQVEKVNSQVGQVTTLLKSLEWLNQETRSTDCNLNHLRQLRDKMDSTTVSILRQMKSVKTHIESFDKANVENRKIFRQGSTVDRTRTAITNGLRFRLKDLMNDFAALRDRIADDHREVIRRKYQELNAGELPSDEILDKLVSRNVEVEEIGKVVGLGCDDEMEERNEVVIDIKRSLDRLQQLFLDMAVLIDAQQDDVDDIEKNVASAGEYIRGGTNTLYYAKQMKHKERKCCYLVLGILVMCVLMLVGIISALAS